MQRKYLFTVIAAVGIVLIFYFGGTTKQTQTNTNESTGIIPNVSSPNESVRVIKHPYADIDFEPIGDIVEVSFPIDNDSEAISYAFSLKDFSEFRENASKDIHGEWSVRVLHRTIEAEKQVEEYFIKEDPGSTRIYIQQFEESKARGDYWELWWKKWDLECTILFRNNGTVLEKYRCGIYNAK